MSWFKVDDGFWGHPKRARCSLAATGLWVVAGSWSAAQLTDGFVPAHMLTMFTARPKEAAELVASDLWLVVEGGWQFADWADYQPTREQVEADREAARNRMRKARNGRRIPPEPTPKFEGSSPEQPENEHGTSEGVRLTPSRPVPSRPVSTSVGTQGGGSVELSAPRPQDHCERHPNGTTDPCRACGQAKRDQAEWDTTDLLRRKTSEQRRQAEDRKLRQAEVDQCQLCDGHGYRVLEGGEMGGLCDHRVKPTAAERRAQIDEERKAIAS